jgi:hypothetical protein
VAATLETVAREGAIDGAPLPELLETLEEDLSRTLDRVDGRRTGDLAWVRRFEIAAALNRLRTLEVVG